VDAQNAQNWTASVVIGIAPKSAQADTVRQPAIDHGHGA
jgi:hypothetical protein